MVHPRPPMPFAPVITVVAGLPSIFRRVSADVQTVFRAIRPNAGARNAVSEGRAGLGRADRISAGSGQQLAVDGLRLSAAIRRSRFWARWQSARGTVTPWVVQVDWLGQAQAVAPADSNYQPTDPQIAFHLARFIHDCRGMPSDGIVLRQHSLRAYDFTTDRGAAALNEYARSNNPFAKLGNTQIAVEISSVIRASPESFRVAWTERRYDGGQLAATERWTAILSVVVETPREADRLRKNPLGVYVKSINWSKELG